MCAVVTQALRWPRSLVIRCVVNRPAFPRHLLLDNLLVTLQIEVLFCSFIITGIATIIVITSLLAWEYWRWSLFKIATSRTHSKRGEKKTVHLQFVWHEHLLQSFWSNIGHHLNISLSSQKSTSVGWRITKLHKDLDYDCLLVREWRTHHVDPRPEDIVPLVAKRGVFVAQVPENNQTLTWVPPISKRSTTVSRRFVRMDLLSGRGFVRTA